MTDLERLDEALERAIPGVGDFGETEPHWPSLRVVFDAARAYRDLLANGERVEWCEVHSLPRAGGIENVCAIAYIPLFDPDEDLPCRIVSRLLVDPPKEEER